MAGRADRSTRLWCLLAALAPDLDGLTLLLGSAAYQEYHHALTHNLVTGGVVIAVSARWVGWRAGPLGLVFAAFVSHLVGDYFGSGPGWALWPLRPFAEVSFLSEHAWDLYGWQNVTITGAALAVGVWAAVVRGHTPLEFVHAGIDRVAVDVLRLRVNPAGCAVCAGRAAVRCHGCQRAVCERHVASWRRLRPYCAGCG